MCRSRPPLPGRGCRKQSCGDGVDQLLARKGPAGTAVWYLTDTRGSVIAEVDDSGTVVKQVQYRGMRAVRQGPSGWEDRYEYTGRDFDERSQLQYNRGRWLD